MANIFVQKLHAKVQEARSVGVRIRDKVVYILGARHLVPNSITKFHDGKHLFSALDVISLSAMSFVYQSVKSTHHIFLEIDCEGYSALHYAAMYSFDEPFDDAFTFAKEFDNECLRDVCISSDNKDRHSVCSLLLETDRYDILHGITLIGVDPFQTEFEDVYISWLHEALFCNAKGTIVYLDNNHRHSMQKALKRSPLSDPPEVLSPMDIILIVHMSHCSKQLDCHCSFYIDQILSPLECGLRLNAYSYHQLMLLKCAGKLEGMSVALSSKQLLEKCLFDTAIWRMAEN